MLPRIGCATCMIVQSHSERFEHQAHVNKIISIGYLQLTQL